MGLLRATRCPADSGDIPSRESIDQAGLTDVRSSQKGDLRKAFLGIIGAPQRPLFKTEIGDSRMMPYSSVSHRQVSRVRWRFRGDRLVPKAFLALGRTRIAFQRDLHDLVHVLHELEVQLALNLRRH